MILLLAGFILTQFFEHTIAPHFHLGEEVHSAKRISTSSAYTAVGGLFIHTFFDGVSIAAASQIDIRIGFLGVYCGVSSQVSGRLHDRVDATRGRKGISRSYHRDIADRGRDACRRSRLRVRWSSFESSIAYALPLASGVTPLRRGKRPDTRGQPPRRQTVRSSSISVFAGVALFFAIHLLVHELVGAAIDRSRGKFWNQSQTRSLLTRGGNLNDARTDWLQEF